MAQSGAAESNNLGRIIDRLAGFEPAGLPVISLYLNAQANENGRQDFERFLRKEFSSLARTFKAQSPERESFDRDVERIDAYLRDELRPETNGVAVFACSGAEWISTRATRCWSPTRTARASSSSRAARPYSETKCRTSRRAARPPAAGRRLDTSATQSSTTRSTRRSCPTYSKRSCARRTSSTSSSRATRSSSRSSRRSSRRRSRTEWSTC